MQCISTHKKAAPVPFLQAMRKVLAGDGGLYVPKQIPALHESFWDSLFDYSLQEIGFKLAHTFLQDEIDDDSLHAIIDDTLNFDVPLVPLTNQLYVLELFHGPTLAFKDFGARFMARLFTRQAQKTDREV